MQLCVFVLIRPYHDVTLCLPRCLQAVGMHISISERADCVRTAWKSLSFSMRVVQILVGF